MPTPTYIPLANVTLGTAVTTVTFSSITQSYTDLILVTTFASNSTAREAWIYFNGDYNSTYSYNVVYAGGTGSTTAVYASTGDGAIQIDAMNTTANTPVMAKFDLMNYSSTSQHKTMIHRRNRADGNVSMTASRWPNTAAITSVSFYFANSFVAGSTFALYGVSA